jgi:two-component system sensor histidine kinase KdpD
MLRYAAILRHPLAGYVAGLAGVALVTWFVDLASDEVNVLSMGVVYQLLVLLVAGAAGLGPGLATGIASALAFNVFFVPPVHTLTIDDTRNWVSLIVFVVTALVTSWLAEGFRRQRAEAEARRRDAELLREMARAALGGVGTAAADVVVGRAAAHALGARWCVIDRGGAAPGGGAEHVQPEPGGFSLPLVAAGRPLGVLRVGPAAEDADACTVSPGFAAAVADLAVVALERSRLVAAEAEAEGLRRSDDLKTALLHGVSHEFRTPLTAIRTAAHALAGPGAPGPEGADALAVLATQTDRLDRLVGNLLDLSRLEAGALTAALDWCSPAEMAAGAVDAAGPLLGGLPVAVEVPSDLPLVRADPVLCERILVNLLHNAARHGAPPLRVRAEVRGGRLLLAVEDAGGGPDPALGDRVFDPFVSGGGAAGTGVGLALSRGLAEAQGARLDREPCPAGTRFALSFALTPVPAA